MLNKQVTKKFLRRVCDIYRSRYGDSRARLNEFTFDYTLVTEDRELEQLISNNFSEKEESFGESFELLFDELRAKGLFEEHPDASYSLTPLGYSEGSRNFLDRSLGFLNNNPGLSIPIAALSLIVSLLALCFSLSGP